jgi:hypothetical protein
VPRTLLRQQDLDTAGVVFAGSASVNSLKSKIMCASTLSINLTFGDPAPMICLSHLPKAEGVGPTPCAPAFSFLQAFRLVSHIFSVVSVGYFRNRRSTLLTAGGAAHSGTSSDTGPRPCSPSLLPGIWTDWDDPH